MATNKAFDYINQNKDRFLEELNEFLRFPSISAQSDHNKDVRDCAVWLKDHLGRLGLETKLIETDGKPIVWARGQGKSDKKVIIYGHYDVQPVDPLDEWKTPPFEPTVKDGHIYARGTTDDKGQLFAHIKAVESLIKAEGGLPCEVLFLVEGEEESNGEALADYITENKVELADRAVGVVVSDSSMYDEKTPAITYALRGVVPLEVTVKGPSCDLHSGQYGGAVGNPAIALAYILSQCLGPDGKVKIKGFYDDARTLEDWERENVKKLNYQDSTLKNEVSVKNLFGEAEYATLERLWARPTFEVNGIFGGYTGEGNKTIIPAKATAKITIRLVPNMDLKKTADLAKEHIRSVCPDFVDLEITGGDAGANAVIFDKNNELIKAGVEALKAGFGSEAVYIGCGGSIPVTLTFWEDLQKPILLMGLGQDSDGAHSPNERFLISSFINGAKASAYLLANI